MSSGRGNGMREEAGAHSADTSAKIDPTKDLADEDKGAWMKRRTAEQRKMKAGQKIEDEWYELVANKKLVKKLKKKNGGVYSLYVCNVTKPKNSWVMSQFVKQANGTYHPKPGGKFDPKAQEA